MAAYWNNNRVGQLQFFTASEVAKMRDRTKSRSYSPAADEFRRAHERDREFGLIQRHAIRLRRGRRTPRPADTAPTPQGPELPATTRISGPPPSRNHPTDQGPAQGSVAPLTPAESPQSGPAQAARLQPAESPQPHPAEPDPPPPLPGTPPSRTAAKLSPPPRHDKTTPLAPTEIRGRAIPPSPARKPGRGTAACETGRPHRTARASLPRCGRRRPSPRQLRPTPDPRPPSLGMPARGRPGDRGPSACWRGSAGRPRSQGIPTGAGRPGDRGPEACRRAARARARR